MRETVDDTWIGLGGYEQYSPYREVFRGATALVLTSVLNDLGLLNSHKSILEIGAGKGGLGDIIGWGNWNHVIQSDSNVAGINENPGGNVTRGRLWWERKYKNKAVIRADGLPLRDESMDAIVGMACLDVMHDPLKTIQETYRVLKPGGYFVHFQDIVPDPKNLIPYELNRGILPFPFAAETTEAYAGYVRLPFANDQVRKLLSAFNIPDTTSKNFIKGYTQFVRLNMLQRTTLDSMSESIRKHIDKIEGVEYSEWGTLFGEVYKELFNLGGFANSEVKWLAGSVIVDRSTLPDAFIKYPEVDAWVNYHGGPSPRIMPVKSQGKMGMASEVLVMVGVKK